MKRMNEPRCGAGMQARVGAVLSVAVLALFVATGAALAGGGNSAVAKMCQKGGWENIQTGTGSPLVFADQDECVAFGARGGVMFAPKLTADPTHVPINTDSIVTGTGFHPNSTGDMHVQVLGGGGGSITLLGLPTSATGGIVFPTTFTDAACANGVTGSEFTFTDAFGLHASTTVTLDC